jgi:hypothetical protein
MLHPEQLTPRVRLRWLVQRFRSPKVLVLGEAAPLSETSKATARVQHPRNGSYVLAFQLNADTPYCEWSPFNGRINVSLKGPRKEVSRTVSEGLFFSNFYTSKRVVNLIAYEVPEEVDRVADAQIENCEPAVGGLYGAEAGRWIVYSTHTW